MILFCKFDAHLGSCSVQIDEAPSSVCLQSDWPNLECHSDSDTHWGLHETSKRGLHWAIEHENSWKWIRAPKTFALLDYIMIYPSRFERASQLVLVKNIGTSQLYLLLDSRTLPGMPRAKLDYMSIWVDGHPFIRIYVPLVRNTDGEMTINHMPSFDHGTHTQRVTMYIMYMHIYIYTYIHMMASRSLLMVNWNGTANCSLLARSAVAFCEVASRIVHPWQVLRRSHQMVGWIGGSYPTKYTTSRWIAALHDGR